jgi:hypothetical protein
MQRKIAKLSDGEGEDAGNRQTKAVAPLRLALTKPFAKETPKILKSHEMASGNWRTTGDQGYDEAGSVE